MLGWRGRWCEDFFIVIHFHKLTVLPFFPDLCWGMWHVRLKTSSGCFANQVADSYPTKPSPPKKTSPHWGYFFFFFGISKLDGTYMMRDPRAFASRNPHSKIQLGSFYETWMKVKNTPKWLGLFARIQLGETVLSERIPPPKIVGLEFINCTEIWRSLVGPGN